MNKRPFYSPRTPTPSHRIQDDNLNAFPFPEEIDTTRLLSDEEEEEVGFQEDIRAEDDQFNTDDQAYGDGNVTPEDSHNTALDLTLEKIGMKRYQWTLL